MPVIELHFFAPEDYNGDTIFECSSDDQFVKQVKLEIQRDKLGHGQVNFARRTGEALLSRDILASEVFVRVLIPEIDSDKYLWGFFLDAHEQKVVSEKEKGGEGFTFGGPGPKFYLTNAVLWPFAFVGSGSYIERPSGVWTWPEAANVGTILNTLINEDSANPHGPFLPDLTKTFTTSLDSDGDPWTNEFSDNDDLTLKIGDDFLKLLWKLEDQGQLFTKINLGSVGDPQIRLDAYQTIAAGGDYGRDLTGALGSGTVHLIEGTNIRTDLDSEGESLTKASHAVVKGHEGLYEIAIRPSWDPGEKRKAVGIAYDSKNDDILDRAGVRYLRSQENGPKGIEVDIVTGFDPVNGLYMPGMQGTDGHVWVADRISLTTGTVGGAQTVLDYNAEPQEVTGIKLELEEAVRNDTLEARARSFKVALLLNHERKNNSTSPGRGRDGSDAPSVIRFCRPGILGGETVEVIRLYMSDNASPISGDVDPDAAWDNVQSSGIDTLTATPDGTFSTTTALSDSQGGDADGRNICKWRAAIEITSDLATRLVAGGGQIRVYARTKHRTGIGISESSQHMISQIGARVVQSDGTVRGTAKALHALTSSAGSLEWDYGVTQNTPVVRAFPPAADSPTLSAVAGTIAGDFLVLEIGNRNYTLVTSGSALYLTSAADSDLTADEIQQTALNSWVELVFVTDAEGYEFREGHPDLVGEGTRVSRCDHAHHVTRDRAPTFADDITQLYPVGTIWYQVDDPENPTVWNATYLLLDNTEGAAVWAATPQSVHGHRLSELDDVDLTTPPTDGQVLVYDADSDSWIPGTVSGSGTQDVRKNSTGSTFSRTRLNFIEGTNVTLTVADDAGNDEVDVTIAASGGSTLPFVSIAKWGND